MQTLIVLGASTRAAAFSIRRAGYQPYAIDLFADRDLAASCPAVKIGRYPHDFLGSLAAAPRAPWIYTGGLENYPGFVDRLTEIRPLLGNRGNALRGVRDPRLLAEAGRDAGCSTPAMEPSSGLPSGAQTNWLVKPLRSSGGLAIRFATADDIARPPRGTYLQEYIAGQSASAVFVAAGGRAALLGVTRQFLGRDFEHGRHFLYVGSMGPLLLREEEYAKLKRLGQVMAERFALVGLFNVDFVRTIDNIWPVEVNPRYSASIEVLERAFNRSFIEAHLQASQQDVFCAAMPNATDQLAGKAIVYARRDANVCSAEFETLIRLWNQPDQLAGVADIPPTGDRFVAGQPIVTVLCEGPSMAEVEAGLRQRVAMIESVLKADHGENYGWSKG